MKAKDMPSVIGCQIAMKMRERLRDLYNQQHGYLEPGQVEAKIFAAFMAGYRHAKKLERAIQLAER